MLEGKVVADSGVDLAEGNIFKTRNVGFTLMICTCKFLQCIGENLLAIDHHKVEFIQRRRKVVSRESQCVNKVINSVVVRCEEEKLGALLVAAYLASHIVG